MSRVSEQNRLFIDINHTVSNKPYTHIKQYYTLLKLFKGALRVVPLIIIQMQSKPDS